ncbi:ATP-binding protein [Vibrio renipiscarius]|uniref:ATP-binding protein n=1 Tax=Vibrio renipiscarius TaxID=1461322 RepID=UPI003553123C
MPSSGPLERKIARESAARKQAEMLLEQKSLELYNANQQLKLVLSQLEIQNLRGLKKLEFESYISESLIHFGRAFLTRILDDGLLSSFVERLSACSLIKAVNLYLVEDVLPTAISNQFGANELCPESPLAIVSQRSTALPLIWQDQTIRLPLKVDHQLIGELSATIDLSDIDAEFLASQMTLVVELLCSAISRQLIVVKNQQARKRAEESERATKEFVAMINHELRTPLNGLLGSAELLSDTMLNNEQTQLLTNLTHSGDLLRHIINDLLDFSKMSAGMMELFPTRFAWLDLKNMLNGIFSPKAQEKQVYFLIEESENMPVAFMADFERISQILVNLIGNAIKFTSEGKVEVSAQWHNEMLQVSIKDTGCGIPAKSQAQLFDPFVQADRTTKRSFEGTGLGLAICKNLVELMNGQIEFSSEVGVGSQFKIQLPLQIAQELAASDAAVDARRESKSLDSLSILVVDDIRMNQIIINQMLKKFSIVPDLADNGLEAVKIAEAKEYDLIFMDCRMPEMDGFEASTYLRSHHYVKPIIALTAGTTLEERERCIESGMDDILTKPYTAADLKAMIEKWA